MSFRQASCKRNRWKRFSAESGVIMQAQISNTLEENHVLDCSAKLTTESKETILLVEDEEFVRRVTGDVLRSAGYAVLTAANSEEALRGYLQNKGRVGMLLSDVILPGESGHALVGKIRMLEPELPILFMTGYARETAAVVNAGLDYLFKPFSSELLLATVRRTIDNRQDDMDSQFKHACAYA